MIKKLVRLMRKNIGIKPEDAFPLMPELPLPEGISEKQLFEFISSVRVGNGEEKEMLAYATQDFRRFVYTWGLANNCSGKCLELGGNPYFTTMLLKKFTQLEISLANYFSLNNGEYVQSVNYRDLNTKEKNTEDFMYQHFNVESDDFPYKDQQFDLVIFAEIIEHLLNDPCKVLREIKRILRLGGSLILTTPNVARLENVARMIAGENIYDPYSGYGPYGRHNREYNVHELVQLLLHEGFEIETHFTADVHDNNAGAYCNLDAIAPLLKFREDGLGQYIFVKAKALQREKQTKKPAWLYRSYPAEELV